MALQGTPVQHKRVSRLRAGTAGPAATPVRIPASPDMTLIGMGTGVNVYSYMRSPRTGCDRSPWAVKRLNKRSASTEYRERLAAEAEILRAIKHPNIVGFRAFVADADGVQCLAMEECETSLGSLISDRLELCVQPFPACNILKVAVDMCAALDYLHTTCHLLHGDIKSFNVLVTGEFEVVKLCDFGVSLRLDEEGVVVDEDEEYVGTECWCAPEVLLDGPITCKADVFAFGLVLWEMMTLCVPHMERSDGTPLCDDSIDEDDFVARLGTRPAVPVLVKADEEYERVLHVFNWCTEGDLKCRPTGRQVIEYLNCGT